MICCNEWVNVLHKKDTSHNKPIALFRVEWSVFFLFPFRPRSVFTFPFSKWEKRWSVDRSLKVLWKVLHFAWVYRFRPRESMIVTQFILWDWMPLKQCFVERATASMLFTHCYVYILYKLFVVNSPISTSTTLNNCRRLRPLPHRK